MPPHRQALKRTFSESSLNLSQSGLVSPSKGSANLLHPIAELPSNIEADSASQYLREHHHYVGRVPSEIGDPSEPILPKH